MLKTTGVVIKPARLGKSAEQLGSTRGGRGASAAVGEGGVATIAGGMLQLHTKKAIDGGKGGGVKKAKVLSGVAAGSSRKRPSRGR